MPPGTPVQVFSPFSSSWVSGFDVATADEDCHEVRRRSDDTARDLPCRWPEGRASVGAV